MALDMKMKAQMAPGTWIAVESAIGNIRNVGRGRGGLANSLAEVERSYALNTYNDASIKVPIPFADTDALVRAIAQLGMKPYYSDRNYTKGGAESQLVLTISDSCPGGMGVTRVKNDLSIAIKNEKGTTRFYAVSPDQAASFLNMVSPRFGANALASGISAAIVY